MNSLSVLWRAGALVLLACLPVAGFTQDAPAPVVVIAPVHAEMLSPTRALQGTVLATRAAALAARSDARVSFIATLGARVGKGDVVARLEDDQARLNVASERTRIDRLTAERALAHRQLARLNAMPDAVPAAQRDEAQARGEVLGAQLAEARVALQTAELELTQLAIAAPFAGIVVEQARQVGEYARAGDSLLRLTDLTTLEIDLAVPVDLALHVKTGALMGFEGTGTPGEAVLTALVPGSADTRQLRARLALPNGYLAPVGTPLTVAWPAASTAVALTVPLDAVIRRVEGLHLLRLDDGVVHSVPITLGTRSGDRVAVIGDLHPGQSVVVRGGERLSDGAKVRVLEAEVVASVEETGPAGS